jgi:signal transduction histidine kinase
MLTETSDFSVSFIAHVSGYATGIILYAMLLGLVFRTLREIPQSFRSDLSGQSPKWLSLWTAILGLLWNVGALLAFLLPHLHLTTPLPLLYAIAVSALGFLPAVVVLAMVETQSAGLPVLVRRGISVTGFLLSGGAGLLHLHAALSGESGSMSDSGLHLMVGGFLVLMVWLLVVRVKTDGWDFMGGIVVLSGLAIAALPFSQHETGEYSWGMEMVGHHGNLLLALAILYQDYRFALGDLFLKRALSFLMLALMTLGALFTLGIPVLEAETHNDMADLSRLGVFLSLWMVTALAYPYVRMGVIWLVDAVVLRRPDYEQLRQHVAVAVNQQEEPEKILSSAGALLQPALLAGHITWRPWNREDEFGAEWPGKVDSLNGDRKEESLRNGAVPVGSLVRKGYRVSSLSRPCGEELLVFIPTLEPPQYVLVVQGFLPRRRLLSDDLVLLEAVAHIVARRIDVVRSAHERCAVAIREQEMRKLTIEAELRALRTQLNPHFLFNALTTIGYLIQTAPARALDTLMRLTELLRGVLKRLEGDFSTLGQEVDLVQAYLMIEQARFEQRLAYQIAVSSDVRDLPVPALVLQPLVENAVKHGIQKWAKGGVIKIGAGVEDRTSSNGHGPSTTRELVITVQDTGYGREDKGQEAAWGTGIGLANIKKRLQLHYGDHATVSMHRSSELGTIVRVRIPMVGASDLVVEESDYVPSIQGGDE